MSKGSRTLLSGLLAAGLLAPRPAPAAEIAVVLSSDVPAWRPAVEALRTAVPGHNVTTYDLHGSRAEADRLLEGLKGSAAVVVAMGPLAAQATREVAADLPLVYTMVSDPAGLGSLEGPNVTGVAFDLPARNQLVAFRTVNPKATRIGVVFNAASLSKPMEDARRSASALRLELVVRQAATLQAVPQVVRDLLAGPQPVDALWIPPDPMLMGEATRRFVIEAAVRAGKPVYSSSASMVKEGALVGSSPEFVSIGHSVGDLVNRITRGEKAGRLGVVVPRAELVINKKIADQLRVAIPEEALKAAQRVF
ncbi:MAG: ABC transporter substrate-binding protein [Vicinamibacteria bacterium]